MSFACDATVWTSEGPRTMLELVDKETGVLVEKDTHLAYASMRVSEVPKQEIVELSLDDDTVLTCGEDQTFFEKKGRKEVSVSDLGKKEFSPHKISRLRKNGLASVYRHKIGDKSAYRGLSNGYRNVYEHHLPFPDRHSSESVHHLNENRADNRPANLKLVRHNEHNTLHHSGKDSFLYKHELSTSEMKKLRAEGLTLRAIGLRLGCNFATVRDRLGLRKSNDEVDPTDVRYRADIDVSQILTLREEGLSVAAIADIMGCHPSTVSRRLRVFKKTNHKVTSLLKARWHPQLYNGNLPNFFLVCEKGGVLVKGNPELG